MKIPWFWLLGLFMMIVSASLLTAAQTSLWFLIFGHFPAPMFWMILLVYVSVTRTLWEATLTTYLLAGAVAPYTVFPFEGFLIYCLSLMIILVLFRERVFWGGATYFMIMVGGASLISPFLFWLCSRWFDKVPLHIPEIFDWLIGLCLTILISPALYRLYQWMDRISAMDAGSESRIGPQ